LLHLLALLAAAPGLLFGDRLVHGFVNGALAAKTLVLFSIPPQLGFLLHLVLPVGLHV